MDEDSLLKLEKRYEITLPPAYRKFLCDFPAELSSAEHQSSGPTFRITDYNCLDSEEELRKVNDLVRTGSDWLFDGSSVGWPRTHFVIGGDGCGNYYTIDTSTSSDAVLFYDHEEGQLFLNSDSVEEFAARMLEDFRRFCAESDKEDEGRAPKEKNIPATIEGRLWAAIEYNSIESLEELLNGGADSNSIVIGVDQFPGTYTLLQYALMLDHSDRATELLLAHGADPKRTARKGTEMPLQIALWCGRLEPVKMLVEAGADPLERGNKGIVPLEAARSYAESEPNYRIIVSYLEEQVEKRGGRR